MKALKHKNNTRVRSVSARKILDSAGNWTIETTLVLGNGSIGVASVPSGVSVSPFAAKNVSARKAVKNVQDVVCKALCERGSYNQRTIDQKLGELDVGANTALSASLAFCRAAAESSNAPLYEYINRELKIGQCKLKIPELMVLVFEGGKHGSGKLCVQEFMTIARDVKQGLKLYGTVRNHLKKVGQPLSVGLEGGFTPDFSDFKALEILNYILDGNPLALDVAFDSCKDKKLNYQKFVGKLNVVSLEDPFSSKDWGTWSEFTKSWETQVMVVADDLVATNTKRLREAIERRAANAVIVKPNQIGTLTKALEVVRLAKEAGWKVIVSHRGSDTNDSFIADLAVGVGADHVKFGGFARGERLSKYNRLLEIESELK